MDCGLPPVIVNDDASGTDQFQPSVAAGPGGAVAVAFYDRRQACPDDPSIRPQDVGRTNFCIDTSLQAYSDSGAGAVPVGGNTRMSTYTWDPMQPDQHVGGIGQMACACTRRPVHVQRLHRRLLRTRDLGRNIYGFFVSTHYPSGVQADEGGPVYYQQQVLATVPR